MSDKDTIEICDFHSDRIEEDEGTITEEVWDDISTCAKCREWGSYDD